MKRRIDVSTGTIKVMAVISSKGLHLTRSEVEQVRDQLADRLQEAVSKLIYLNTPRHRVRVGR